MRRVREWMAGGPPPHGLPSLRQPPTARAVEDCLDATAVLMDRSPDPPAARATAGRGPWRYGPAGRQTLAHVPYDNPARWKSSMTLHEIRVEDLSSRRASVNWRGHSISPVSPSAAPPVPANTSCPSGRTFRPRVSGAPRPPVAARSVDRTRRIRGGNARAKGGPRSPRKALWHSDSESHRFRDREDPCGRQFHRSDGAPTLRIPVLHARGQASELRERTAMPPRRDRQSSIPPLGREGSGP